MALETLEFDAAGSNVDGTNPGTALMVMSTSANYYVDAFSSPAPAPKLLWASSIDTDGARRADPASYENRQVTLTVVPKDSSSSSTHEDALKAKVAKLHREGGTLKWTRKDGSVRIFDLLASDGYTTTIDIRYENGRAEVQLSFLALPGMRGTEQDLGDNVETTLPCLIFTEASIPGDLLALGRLVIDNDAAADQWWVTWGLQSRYYSSSANAALFYEAEGRTAMGGAAVGSSFGGGSGAGSNLMQQTSLTTSWQAMLSTQATGGGAHLSHVGTFRVYARVVAPNTSPASTVSLALEWGEGDYRTPTQNPQVDIEQGYKGQWLLVDLGLVSLTPVATGTQRWEGRILAKSTRLTEDVYIDYLMMVPVDEGSGVATAVARSAAATTFSARDEFDQTAGALSGKTLPVGGTWSGAGDADDYQVSGAGVVTRSAVSDASMITGRFGLAGAATFTTVQASVDLTQAAGSVTYAADTFSGLLLRYVDTSNWVAVGRLLRSASNDAALVMYVTVAGATTPLYAFATVPPEPALGAGATATIGASISSTGQYAVTLNGVIKMTGSRFDLATGGTLASGRVGLYDVIRTAAMPARTFDNFWVTVPPVDAALFASQSLEVRHDRVIREDSTGTLWSRVSSHEGDYLRVPPSGAEGRTARFIVKASRGLPGTGTDSAIDDISARLFVTPRYL